MKSIWLSSNNNSFCWPKQLPKSTQRSIQTFTHIRTRTWMAKFTSTNTSTTNVSLHTCSRLVHSSHISSVSDPTFCHQNRAACWPEWARASSNKHFCSKPREWKDNWATLLQSNQSLALNTASIKTLWTVGWKRARLANKWWYLSLFWNGEMFHRNTADRANTFADLYWTKDTNVLSLQSAFKLWFSHELMLWYFNTIFS